MAIKFDIPGKKVAFSAANNAPGFSTAASAGASADHTRLSNRDAADQHPMSAITGLQAALAEKADADDIPSLAGYATEAYVNGHHDSTKQDKISDLSTIRSGAAKGATAIQAESDPTVPSWAKAAQKPTYTAYEVGAAEAVHRHTLDDLDGQLVETVNGISPDIDGNVALPTPNIFTAAINPWGVSGNTAKFNKTSFPTAAVGDYIITQGVIYEVTSTAESAVISVLIIGNAIEGATGAAYITASNAGWGISGDNRSFDRVKLSPNAPAVGSIIYSATAGMYFTVTTVESATVKVTRIFKDVTDIPSLDGYATEAYVNGAVTSLQSAIDEKADADDIPSLDGYATEAYVNGHHDSSKQDKISDLATIRSGAARGATSLQTESDPTVPSWAKASQKPTYTAAEVGAAEAEHKHTVDDVESFRPMELTLKPNTYIETDGSETPLSGWTSTDFIPVVPGKKYELYWNRTGSYCGWYKSDKSFLSRTIFDSGMSDVFPPSPAAFLRVSNMDSAMATLTISTMQALSIPSDSHINDLIAAALSALDGNGVSY